MQNSPKPQMQVDETKTTINIEASQLKDKLTYSPYQLSFILQSSLNLYEILKRFNAELNKVIAYQSLHYYHSKTKQQFELGKLHYHQARYQLKIENLDLGELTLSKNVPFSEEELSIIESALVQLLFPVKNALAHEQAIKLSITDPLTKLNNRQGFDIALSREVEFSKRHRSNTSLLVIDLDNFKNINDTYGHLAGDAVLHQFADSLRELHRQTDMIFRYGGEEFTIILSHTAENGAMQVASRICQAIYETQFKYEGTVIPVTVSIGVSTHQTTENSKSLFSRADSALYAAKSNGRNQVKMS
tara:strand:+ start:6884 stop:7789 length:906 start_codon:yes stop_codon:yes gene_type:complete